MTTDSDYGGFGCFLELKWPIWMSYLNSKRYKPQISVKSKKRVLDELQSLNEISNQWHGKESIQIDRAFLDNVLESVLTRNWVGIAFENKLQYL